MSICNFLELSQEINVKLNEYIFKIVRLICISNMHTPIVLI